MNIQSHDFEISYETSQEPKTFGEVDISVIVLSYNQDQFVIQNLEAFERQSFINFELIVADDCSTDNSASEIKNWSLNTKLNHRLIFNTSNLGVCSNINNALKYAKGKYVSVIAADDWPDVNFLSEMFNAINSANENVALVFAGINQVDEGGSLLETHKNSDNHQQNSDDLLLKEFSSNEMFSLLLAANVIPAPAVLTRKEVLFEFNGYDESLLFEDYDMWLKIASRYRFIEVKQNLVNYRILPTSLSRDLKWFIARKQSEIKLLSKWFGLSSSTDLIIANRVRTLCLELIIFDHHAGDAVYQHLSLVHGYVPRARWLVFAKIVSIPFLAGVVRFAFRWEKNLGNSN